MIEHELIVAIAAAPDDDAPRMVYADWLMQRGDPRGEFIALQCRIARADAADEVIDDNVIARERELRETHADAWLAPLRAIVDAGYVFRRGFVEHVAVWSEHDIADRDPAAEQPPTDRLAELLDIAPLLRSIAVSGAVLGCTITPAWSRVRSVTLCEPTGDEATIAAFLAAASSLRRLQLANASIYTGVAGAWLGRAQPLEHLGLQSGVHSNKPEGESVIRLLETNRALHGLRSLHLGGFDIPDLRPLGRLQKLERLALHACRASVRKVIELVSQLPALAVLELDSDDPAIEDLGVGELLAAAPKLRRLAFRRWAIGSAGAYVIANSPSAAGLRRLEIEQCGIGNREAEALLASPHLSDLARLHVVDPLLTDATTIGALDVRDRLHYEAPPPAYAPEVVEHLPRNKIMAIKGHRERTRAGLADSKMAVERMAEDYGFGVASQMRATTRWCRP